jgi:exopolysaccharide biosynthesis polyprenyl glycosylphosphotransferase
MLRENTSVIRGTLMFVDVGLVVLAYLTTLAIRFADPTHLDHLPLHLAIVLFSVVFWHLGLRYVGAYASIRQRSPLMLAGMVLQVALALVIILTSLLYLLKWGEISRLIIVLFPLIVSIYLIAMRWVALSLLWRLREYGLNQRNILLVGTDAQAQDYARRIYLNMRWGFRIFGYLTLDASELGKELYTSPILGLYKGPKALRELLLTQTIDRIAFSGLAGDDLAGCLEVCEELGIDGVVIPNFGNLLVARIHVEDFFGIPIVRYTMTPQQTGQLILKQVMDTALSALALVMLAPFFLLIALLIKLDSSGPVLFSQPRAGLRGRTFHCLKFRTMAVDAEKQLAELQHHNEMSGPVFKMRNDPRVTRFGAFLRKTSLDELPQLINILRGEMSIVGPRPPIPCEVAAYEPWQRRRLSMKPGLTCIWQVSGRNEIDFEQWMRLDLEYIDRWCLRLDLELIAKTLPAMLRGTGV